MQQILTPKETAAYLRVSDATLKAWRRDGKGPAYLKLGRAIRYEESQLERYRQASTIQPGSAA